MIPILVKTQRKAMIANTLVKIPLFLATIGIGRLVKLMIFCLSINISKMLLINAIMTSTGNPSEKSEMNPN